MAAGDKLLLDSDVADNLLLDSDVADELLLEPAAAPGGASNYYLGGNAMNRGQRGSGWAARRRADNPAE